jgi:hypothetical protein
MHTTTGGSKPYSDDVIQYKHTFFFINTKDSRHCLTASAGF